MKKPHQYDPDTLPELISYIRKRRDAIKSSLDLAASYSGPDPSPGSTAKDQATVAALDAVLVAIRDIETEKAKRRIEADLDV